MVRTALGRTGTLTDVVSVPLHHTSRLRATTKKEATSYGHHIEDYDSFRAYRSRILANLCRVRTNPVLCRRNHAPGDNILEEKDQDNRCVRTSRAMVSENAHPVEEAGVVQTKKTSGKQVQQLER